MFVIGILFDVVKKYSEVAIQLRCCDFYCDSMIDMSFEVSLTYLNHFKVQIFRPCRCSGAEITQVVLNSEVLKVTKTVCFSYFLIWYKMMSTLRFCKH
jgi:hypothetical protein